MAEARVQPRDTTAQTLNYVLGNLGGKQKSWMVGASGTTHVPPPLIPEPLPTAKRLRGRPRKHQPGLQAQPQITESSFPSIEPQAERLPSSNSTSPQLANVVVGHDNASSEPLAVTVFPSPTPSEENVDDVRAQSSHNSTDPVTNIHYLAGSANGSNVFQIASENPLLDAVRCEVPHSKRPMEANVQGADKRTRVEGSRQQPPPAVASTWSAPSSISTEVGIARPSSALFQQDSEMLEHNSNRSPPLMQHSNGQLSLPVHPSLSSVVPVSSNTLPQLQASFVRPPVLPQEMLRSNYPSTSASAPQVQHGSASTNNWYTMQDCLRKLDAFRESHSQVSQLHFRDNARLAMLRDAAEKHDWPYLTMHQYYCALTLSPKAVPAAIRQQPNLNEALSVMYNALDANKHLSPAFLQFSSLFPYPVWDLSAHWPEMFQHQLQLFVSFIVKSPHYEQLKSICHARRLPPLAHELTADLSIASLTFQRLVFTAQLRSIFKISLQYEKHKKFERHAIKIFQSNQIAFQQRQARMSHLPSADPLARQQAEQEASYWSSQLKWLFEKNQFSTSSSGNPHMALPQQSHSATDVQAPTMPSIHSQHPMNSGITTPRHAGPVEPHSVQVSQQQVRGPGPYNRPGANQHGPQPLAPPQQRQHTMQRPRSFLQAPGVVLPQQRQANPARFSLHQAHLRSPVLHAKSAPLPLYHFLEGFIKFPARLSEGSRAIERWTFTLTQGDMQTFTQPVRDSASGPDVLMVDEKSKTMRVRCIKWHEAELPVDHKWAIADTAWVPYSYFTLNGTSLQQRKKVHNGKDLPIDITGLVREGENVLEVVVMALSDDTSHLAYLTAIEVLGVATHDTIRQQCLETNHHVAQDVLQNIKMKLSGGSDDDEIAIVESNLTINLFDPFSASKICDIPVRGKACRHNDCFDLETFLQTRRRKGDASVPDQWRCPICNADARPQQLMVDGFLEDVKRQLEAQGLSQTRAIIVQQDGSWKPKAEVRDPNGVSDESPTPTTTRPMSAIQAEIIDLSD